MASIVTFRQDRGTERTWVPRAEEDYWIGFWAKLGVPAARLSDYREWGGFFPPVTDSADRVMVTRKRRGHRDYRRFTLP